MSAHDQSLVRHRPVIRVFVSSTFADLKQERDALQQNTFQRLEVDCANRGFQFQAIDLRWGVPSEASLDHRTMRICFEELRRSQDISPEPNFLILLGNRYGWRPLPEDIFEAEFHDLELAIREKLPANDRLLAKTTLDLWYRRDENNNPPVYILRSRLSAPADGKNYGRVTDANGKENDSPDWLGVQDILWSIINKAFPADGLNARFGAALENYLCQVANDPKAPLPSIVRFQASATEQEIWRGAFAAANAGEHVVAFVRKIDNGAKFSQVRQDFVDADQGPLDELKAKLKERLGQNIVTSSKQVLLTKSTNEKGEEIFDVSTEHLKEMWDRIYTLLEPIINRQIDKYWGTADRSLRTAELDILEHRRFSEERAPEHSFVGRTDKLDAIAAYLQNDSRQPLVIHGESGCGKTALLARASQLAGPKWKPIVRFLGVTPHSSDIRSLLASICQELRRLYPRSDGLSGDVNELTKELHAHLKAATADKPLILFLDALDQLSDADNGRTLNWIPFGPLPEYAKFIVSCLSDRQSDDPAGEPFAALKQRGFAEQNFINLDALSADEAQMLVFDRWLPEAGRHLNQEQQRRVQDRLKTDVCRQPLYLKILFEEARLWRSYDPTPHLGENVADLMGDLLDRLAAPANHGPTVECVLGYITSARRGLTETEILEVLYKEREYEDSRFKKLLDEMASKHELPTEPARIPSAIWSRLRFDLGFYLTEHAAPGGTVLNVYHRQVSDYVRAHFLASPLQRITCHERLARFFHQQDYLLESLEEQLQCAQQVSPTSSPVNVRKVDELLWQRLHAGDMHECARLLSDWNYLEAKTRARMVFELVQEFAVPIETLVESLSAKESIPRQEVAAKSPIEIIQHFLRLLSFGRLFPSQSLISSQAPVLAPTTSLLPWQSFIRSQAPVLSAHPELFFQQAFNEAKESPVSLAAQARRAQQRDAWVEWLNRPKKFSPPACRQVLFGHTKEVSAVCVTSDGHLAVSGSLDQTIRVWDLKTGKCLHSLQGHTKEVTSVTLTRDGRLAVSGSVDKTVRVWDLAAGQCLHSLEGHEDVVIAVSVSGDGRLAISGSHDKTVRVWDLTTGQCIRILQGNMNSVNAVSVTGDGRFAVSGSSDESVRGWDLATGQCLHTLPQGQGSVTSVSVMWDGHRAISGSNVWVMVWDLTIGQYFVLWGHLRTVNAVSITGDGRRAVSGSDDMTVRVWDLATRQCLYVFRGHESRVNAVSVTADGRLAVSGSSDKTVQVWDLSSQQGLLTFQEHEKLADKVVDKRHAAMIQRGYDDGEEDPVSVVRISGDGRRAVSESRHQVRVWDPAVGRCLRTLTGWVVEMDVVSVSRDGRRLVSGYTNDCNVLVWDRSTGKCVFTLERHKGPVFAVSVTADGRRAVSWSEDNTARLWDLAMCQCLHVLHGHEDEVNTVSVTGDGRLVVSGSRDKTVRVWDLTTGKCTRILQGHTEDVTGVSITGDGRLVVSGSRDKTVRVWDLTTGRCLYVLQGHTEVVIAVSVTVDGRRAVSGSRDNTVRVWDLATGQCLFTLQGHERSVSAVSVTADGRRAVSSSSDSVRVWDLPMGQCLHTLQTHDDGVKTVSVTADGRRVTVYPGQGRTVLVWDLATGQCVQAPQGDTGWVKAVSVTADGRLAVSSSSDLYSFREKTVQVWDLTTGQCLQTLKGHERTVSAVSVTEDGRLAVSGSEDKTVRVWNLWSLAAGKDTHTLRQNVSKVEGVRVTADGRRAVSTGSDKTVRVWDMSTGECLATYPQDSDEAKRAWRETQIQPITLENEGFAFVWRQRESGAVLGRFPGSFTGDCSDDGSIAIAFNFKGEAHFFHLHRP